jgi:hypothetical protein
VPGNPFWSDLPSEQKELEDVMTLERIQPGQTAKTETPNPKPAQGGSGTAPAGEVTGVVGSVSAMPSDPLPVLALGGHVRRDLHDFFGQYLLMQHAPLAHHPVLVFTRQWVPGHAGGQVVVTAETMVEAVLTYPPDTCCLAQWPGKFRSDYFLFTVADLTAARYAAHHKTTEIAD